MSSQEIQQFDEVPKFEILTTEYVSFKGSLLPTGKMVLMMHIPEELKWTKELYSKVLDNLSDILIHLENKGFKEVYAMSEPGEDKLKLTSQLGFNLIQIVHKVDESKEPLLLVYKMEDI